MDATYTVWQRFVALIYGVGCHVSFVTGIGAMMLGLYGGMTIGRGPLTGTSGWICDLLLLLQFGVVHSFLLSARGRRLLARLAPRAIGEQLRTTSFALIASLQLLLTFGAWSPMGPIWWEPHGALRIVISIAYGLSWLLLLRAMADAGLAVHTGFLGWGAVLRGRVPRYRDFSARGTFRFVRQPVYLAFTLTLWTGPVWTPDHFLLAALWTLYCLIGPVLKERRYLDFYGGRFQRYRERVPYWLPAFRRLDARHFD